MLGKMLDAVSATIRTSPVLPEAIQNLSG